MHIDIYLNGVAKTPDATTTQTKACSLSNPGATPALIVVPESSTDQLSTERLSTSPVVKEYPVSEGVSNHSKSFRPGYVSLINPSAVVESVGGVAITLRAKIPKEPSRTSATKSPLTSLSPKLNDAIPPHC